MIPVGTAQQKSVSLVAMKMLYEGKAKRLYETDQPNVLRMEFKDEATAFNAKKRSQFEEKGHLNKEISLLLYRMMEKAGISTHLVDDLSETELLVRQVDIIPVEVIVRNLAAGSFLSRTGFTEGAEFTQPIVEFSYKSDELGDPLINEDYARELNLATSEECRMLREQALKINEVLSDFFEKAGLRLVDFKIEFGRDAETGALLLADEVSPDTCRLWDLETGRKLDKDRFREDLGEVMEGYQEVLGRVKHSASE